VIGRKAGIARRLSAICHAVIEGTLKMLASCRDETDTTGRSSAGYFLQWLSDRATTTCAFGN
jgi:hypothetical protein